MQYFVAIEICITGYFIGKYKSLKKAKSIHKRLSEMAARYEFRDCEKLIDDLSGHKKYTVLSTDLVKSKMLTSNGAVNIYLCQYDEIWDAEAEDFIRVRSTLPDTSGLNLIYNLALNHLKQRINEVQVGHVLNIRFLDKPDIMVNPKLIYEGYCIADDQCNMPIVLNDTGVYLLCPESKDNWTSDHIALDVDEFANILNLLVKELGNYVSGEELPEWVCIPVQTEILRKIRKLSAASNLQYWSDILSGYFSDYEHSKEIKASINSEYPLQEAGSKSKLKVQTSLPSFRLN